MTHESEKTNSGIDALLSEARTSITEGQLSKGISLIYKIIDEADVPNNSVSSFLCYAASLDLFDSVQKDALTDAQILFKEESIDLPQIASKHDILARLK